MNRNECIELVLSLIDEHDREKGYWLYREVLESRKRYVYEKVGEIIQEASEAEEDLVKELEERQEATGFYAYQNAVDAWKNER